LTASNRPSPSAVGRVARVVRVVVVVGFGAVVAGRLAVEVVVVVRVVVVVVRGALLGRLVVVVVGAGFTRVDFP
jgi:hypothetical protein